VLSTSKLLELLNLFERAHQLVPCVGGVHQQGVPAWALQNLQHLRPADLDDWTERVGFATEYPAPFDDELVPVDLRQNDDGEHFTYRCPETFRIKRIRAEHASVRAVCAEPLLNLVADLLDTPGSTRKIREPLIDGRLWLLGRKRVGHVHFDIWIVRGLVGCLDDVYRHFQSALLPDRGLVLSTGAGMPNLARSIRAYRVVPIAHVLAGNGSAAAVDNDLLHRVLVGAPEHADSAKHPVQFNDITNTLTIATRNIAPWVIRGKIQREVVRYLVDQLHLRRDWIGTHEIMDAAYGAQKIGRSKRVTEIFKGNLRWLDYIEHDGDGRYRINST